MFSSPKQVGGVNQECVCDSTMAAHKQLLRQHSRDSPKKPSENFLSAFWGDDFLTKLQRKPGEKRNNPLEKIQLRRAKWGWILHGGVSQIVPKCPVLALFCPDSSPVRPQKRQKRTNGDKTGPFETIRETPPFRIYPPPFNATHPLTRNYCENNSLRIIFRNFRGILHPQNLKSPGKKDFFQKNYV